MRHPSGRTTQPLDLAFWPLDLAFLTSRPHISGLSTWHFWPLDLAFLASRGHVCGQWAGRP